MSSKSEAGIYFSEEECIIKSKRQKVQKQLKENID